MLADRVPANYAAIVMDAPKDELSCMTYSDKFSDNGKLISRGVISYYATLTLPKAKNLENWLEAIDAQIKSHIQEKKIIAIRYRKLKIIGNSKIGLLGKLRK